MNGQVRIIDTRSKESSIAKSAQLLQSKAEVNTAPPSSNAAVVNIDGGTQFMPSFAVTLNNSAGMVTKKYVIGDPTGLIASLAGGGYSAADSGSVTPSLMNLTFNRGVVLVGVINYETTVGVAQFAASFKSAKVEIDGTLTPFNYASAISAARRNTAFNAKLLTVTLNEPLVLSTFSALLVEVIAGETVILTFTPVGAAGRI